MNNKLNKLTEEIKTVEEEIKTVEEKINSCKDQEIQELFNYKLDAKKKELSSLENKLENERKKEEELKLIKNLSISEIEEKIKNKEIKLSKERLKILQKEKSKEELKQEVKELTPLYCNTNGNKTSKGYMIKTDNNNYYCIAFNHIAIHTKITKNKLTFEFNNKHDKFTGTPCVCIMKEFITHIFSIYELDLSKFFTTLSKQEQEESNKLGLLTFKESLKDILLLLANSEIDLQTQEVTNKNYTQISINKKIDSIIKELQY